MDKPQVDLEELLRQCECHFNWDLEAFEKSYESPTSHVDEFIRSYNAFGSSCEHRRFRVCLYLTYTMYRYGLDGWDKMLENAFRIMENSRGADYPEELDMLPNYNVDLYSGPTQKFFLQRGDLTTNSVSEEGSDHDSLSEDHEMGEELYDSTSTHGYVLQQWRDLCPYWLGLYVAAEHIFYSLKATIMYRNGSSPNVVRELLSHAVHMDDMAPGDKAAVLFFKAFTSRCSGDKGLDKAIDVLKTSILTDPDNLRWPLQLIIFSGEKRRTQWGKTVDVLEVLSIVKVIDSVLQHDLKPWMRVRFQFDKLQALNEMCKSGKVPPQERAMHYQTCNELTEELLHTGNTTYILAYCAQCMSSSHKKIPKAIKVIESVLEICPDDVYVNAKACNIYKKAGKLDKALECAEKAAHDCGYGSVWQVVELKLALNHEIDYEEYFCDIIKKYSGDEHVKCTHKNAALFYVVQGDFKRALEHFKVLLDVCDCGDYILGELYCGFNGKVVLTLEAAYNVALYVMSSEYKHDNEGLAYLCDTIREKIEDVFDINDFNNNNQRTSKHYVEWLRQKRLRNIGPHDSNESRMPYHRSGWFARDDHSTDRVPAYQSRSVMLDSGVKNQNVGFWSDSRHNTVTYNQNHSPRQNYDCDRYSEQGGTYPPSAQNMANYFGQLEGATGSARYDFSKPRTTQPQSDGAYHGYNQRNYSDKPLISRNWRSRDETVRGAPANASQSSSRRPADLSRNWRDRD